MGSKWVLHMPTEGENQRKEAAKREYGMFAGRTDLAGRLELCGHRPHVSFGLMSWTPLAWKSTFWRVLRQLSFNGFGWVWCSHLQLQLDEIWCTQMLLHLDEIWCTQMLLHLDRSCSIYLSLVLPDATPIRLHGRAVFEFRIFWNYRTETYL